MTTAVAELPAAVSAVEIAPAAPRPKDRYRWLAAQREALVRIFGAGRRVGGVDLEMLDEELNSRMSEVRMTFTSHVENIVDHMARIQLAVDPDGIRSMVIEIAAFRRHLAKFMLEHPSLQSTYEELFDKARSDGLRLAVGKILKKTAPRGPMGKFTKTSRALELRLGVECGYCFEHVVAFDGRECRDLGNGRSTGRAMDDLDDLTYPPEVARVINAGCPDPDDRLPILEEGRMAQDPPGVTYERLLRRDRRRGPVE